jgi:hypothetical protein
MQWSDYPQQTKFTQNDKGVKHMQSIADLLRNHKVVCLFVAGILYLYLEP